MDLHITHEELEFLYGLPHLQQLVYLRGIRPYMDLQTSLAGVKRRISYQSIAEQLYVEPHQGIRAEKISRDQIRRAVAGLDRAGVIDVQSEGTQLILKCNLVSRGYSVQNKAAINPPQKAITNQSHENAEAIRLFENEMEKADIAQTQKAAIPLNNNKNNNNNNKKLPIAADFKPNTATLVRAHELGYVNADEACEIQAFIDFNKASGSLFADFNPIYLRWLAKRKAKQSLPKSRSTHGTSNADNSHKLSPIERVKRAYASQFSFNEQTRCFENNPASKLYSHPVVAAD